MEHMVERNSEALASAAEKINATLTSRDGHTLLEVPSRSFSPSPSAHTFLVAEKGTAYPPARAHTFQVASGNVDFCRDAPTGIKKRSELIYHLPP